MRCTNPRQIEFYEGLVQKTAARYLVRIRERAPDLEFDDVCQILRLKAWRGIESFDPARATQPINEYVFSCVFNQVKDLIKRKPRGDLFIEDVTRLSGSDRDVSVRESFDAQYLTETEEEAFAEILAETPLIPSTLSGIEQRVVVCLYLEYGQAEIAETLSLSKRDVARRVKSIKEKMADWRPSSPAAGTHSNGDHRSIPLKETIEDEHHRLPEAA